LILVFLFPRDLDSAMPVVRFAWNPQLVDLRREVCPRARWNKSARAWSMTSAEAEIFLTESHARLEFCRSASEIAIDEDRWLVGYVRGAPCRR
jgi:hypothetical protein